MVTAHWHWQTDRFYSTVSCAAVPVRLWLCLALWLHLTCDRHCQTGPAAISLLVSLVLKLNIVTNRAERGVLYMHTYVWLSGIFLSLKLWTVACHIIKGLREQVFKCPLRNEMGVQVGRLCMVVLSVYLCNTNRSTFGKSFASVLSSSCVALLVLLKPLPVKNRKGSAHDIIIYSSCSAVFAHHGHGTTDTKWQP